MTELGKILYIVQLLESSELSAGSLAGAVGVSVATVKRYVAEARRMGARIESIGGGQNPWYYRLSNWEAVRERVNLWATLEAQRDLRLPI